MLEPLLRRYPLGDPLLTSMNFRGEMPIRSTNASKLLVVRRCIIDFADRFLGELAIQEEHVAADPNARTYRVLLGQPGIGKTMSLNYLVFRLLNAQRSVVILKNYDKYTTVHVFHLDKNTVHVTQWDALSPIDVINCLMRAYDETQPTPPQRPVVLQDGCQIDETLPQTFDCVLSSSPRESNWYSSCKQSNGRTYYIPTWNAAEMELANQHKLFGYDALPDEVLATRLEWGGGSVRRVFRGGDINEETEALESIVREVLVPFIRSGCNLYDLFTFKKDESHRIIKVEPKPGTYHRECIRLPLSGTVARLMCEEATKAQQHQMLNWLRTSQGVYPELSGDAFEHVAHAWLVAFPRASLAALNTLRCLTAGPPQPRAPYPTLFPHINVQQFVTNYQLQRVNLMERWRAPHWRRVITTCPHGHPPILWWTRGCCIPMGH